MTDTILWHCPRSAARYRVRIALNLAGIDYRRENMDLVTGQHRSDAHRVRNPQGLVPVLDIDGARLTVSLAILDDLDDTRDMGLLPGDPVDRAKAHGLAHALAVDVHPVCNLSVATHATGGLDRARTDWMRRFIATGANSGLADICLTAQLYKARRWGVDFADCERIARVGAACADLPEVQAARPDV